MCGKIHVCPITVEHILFGEFPEITNQRIGGSETLVCLQKEGLNYIEIVYLASSFYTNTK